MRNFKKLIAMGTALAMAIIMNVSAFADGDGTQANPYTNAYDNGAVVVSAIKAALPTMTEGAQYTVVVVPVGEEISDSNIHYINQADGSDAIWATTTTWGTPAALADGTYVVRVGDEAGNVDETYFRIGSTQPPVQQGPKVIFKNGATLVEEVASVDGKIVLTQTVPTLVATEGYAADGYEFVEWVNENGTAIAEGSDITEDIIVYPKFKAQIINNNELIDMVYGDVTGDGVILPLDKTYLNLQISAGRKMGITNEQVSPLLYSTDGTVLIVTGDVTGDGVILPLDKTYLNLHISAGRKMGKTNENYYVVNK